MLGYDASIFMQNSFETLAGNPQHWRITGVHKGELTTYNTLPPQPFYGPFSGTTCVSRCQKRTSGLYGARED